MAGNGETTAPATHSFPAASDGLQGLAEAVGIGRPSRFAGSVPVSAGSQVWLATILVSADLTATVTSGLAVAHVAGFNGWALACIVIIGALCIEAAGHALGLHAVRSAAHLQRSCLAVTGLGLLVIATAVLIGYDIGAMPPWRSILIGGTTILVLSLLRLLLAGWVERHPALLAEQSVLVGTPQAVAQLLALDAASSKPQCVAGWIAIVDGPDRPVEAIGQVPLLTIIEASRLGVDPMPDDSSGVDQVLGRLPRLNRVLIASADLDEAAVAAILGQVEHLAAEIALAPLGAALSETKDALDPSRCVILRRPGISAWARVAKSALDMIVASILIVALSPVLLLIAALIRRGSPGPALFRQTRWGLNNAPFAVFKFRTMYLDSTAADGIIQAIRGDERVTPIGALLRRSSLDELPQLLNVLNGTMSLVGPRPHPVELNRRYLGVVARYAGRHRVMPGITGLAQVSGCRGETHSASAMQRRVEFDLDYIRNRSFGFDIWIMLRTIVSVVRGGDAY